MGSKRLTPTRVGKMASKCLLFCIHINKKCYISVSNNFFGHPAILLSLVTHIIWYIVFKSEPLESI